MTLPIYVIKVVSTGTASSVPSNVRTNSPTKSSWKSTTLENWSDGYTTLYSSMFMSHKHTLYQGCTNPGRQVAQANVFYTVAPNIGDP